jgi:hypothetical protein
MRFSTLPFYDERWFEDLYAIISVEDANPRDKVMMGMLASLGIEKGKPYNPDAKTKQAMRQAAIDAYFYPGFPIWIRPTRPRAAEMLAKPRIPFFTRRVRQASATWFTVRA